MRTNINEPFLFVVVGEVKAGKSSFVNALLQADICKTAADPCTDVIQQIVYSEDEFEQPRGQYLRKIGLPNEILKTLSVVDTPGTNTIVENHQEITKDFIPNSDLSAKLNSKLDIIYEEIERNFVNIYDYVEAEEQKVWPLVDRFKQIEQEANFIFIEQT